MLLPTRKEEGNFLITVTFYLQKHDCVFQNIDLLPSNYEILCQNSDFRVMTFSGKILRCKVIILKKFLIILRKISRYYEILNTDYLLTYLYLCQYFAKQSHFLEKVNQTLVKVSLFQQQWQKWSFIKVCKKMSLK